LVQQLEAKRAEAALGGPARSRERHTARGKLLPRERVLRLLDPGTPFLELSPLAANGMYEDAIHGAGIITGIGRIEGRDCGIVRKQGTSFLAGPPLVKAATGEVVSAEDLGGADVHARLSGVADHYAIDDGHALALVRRIVANFNAGKRADVDLQVPRDPLFDA